MAAFNPAMYEHVYGSDVLDTIHNYYPELLYDDALFPFNALRWMRHRTQTLFPQAFAQKQNQYRLYQSNQRRRDMVEWRRSLNPLAEPYVPAATPASRNSTRIETSHRLPSARVETTVRTVNLGSPALLPPVGGELASLVNILSLLGGAADLQTSQEDVLIVPTPEQIQAGSSIVDNVPEHVTCAICQDAPDEVRQWRKLNCNHYFHKQCVDTWFERNVHCPVCRHDIRESGHESV